MCLFAAGVASSSQFDRLLLSDASLAETLQLVALKLHFHESTLPPIFFKFISTYSMLCIFPQKSFNIYSSCKYLQM